MRSIFTLMAVGVSTVSSMAQTVPQAVVAKAVCKSVPSRSSGYQVDITWKVTHKFQKYRVLRNQEVIAQVASITSFSDHNVQRGLPYTYQIAGVMQNGKLQYSNIQLIDIPGRTQTSTMFLPPVGVRIKGIWLPNTQNVQYYSGSTDILSWDRRAGAVRYNIYRYDTKIGDTAENQFMVPLDAFKPGFTYTVTSVDIDGNESLPSACVGSQGANDPRNLGNILKPAPPYPPDSLTVNAQWNNGAPRNLIRWNDTGWGWNVMTWVQTHNIYRDGVLLASGVWGVEYIDEAVRPGQTYVYTVATANVSGDKDQQSILPKAVSCQTASAAPAPSSRVPSIVSTKPNDDSIQVTFTPVPGAEDYRIRVVNQPYVHKYTGGSNRVELNGLLPDTSYDVVVEALDKHGPFQKMDGVMGPGSMLPGNLTRMEINGQGSPSNVPIVLSASPISTVSTKSRIMTGSQVFFDTFRGSAPIRRKAPDRATMIARTGKALLLDGQGRDMTDLWFKWFENDKWSFFFDDLDQNASVAFMMGNHFMDTIYDGATLPYPGPAHQTNGAMVMSPKANADISNGRVLHVTFEVDPHFSGRRWTDVILYPAGDTLISGKSFDKIAHNTLSDKSLVWSITEQRHGVRMATGRDSSLNRIVRDVNVAYPERKSNLPRPFQEVDAPQVEHKIGTFVGTSTGPNAYSVTYSYGTPDKKFPAFTATSRCETYAPSEWGALLKWNVTPDQMEVVSDIWMTQPSWWVGVHNDKRYSDLLKAYSDSKEGLITIRGRFDAKLGKYVGDVYLTPLPSLRETPLNGTISDLDKRVRYDMYISKSKLRIIEDGILISESDLPVPLDYDKVSVAFSHLIYHTENELGDNMRWNPANRYWINHRPFADERHWDNMGFEVLNDFPAVPKRF